MDMLSRDDIVDVEMVERLVHDVIAYSAVSSDGRVRFNADVADLDDIADRYEIDREVLRRIIMLAARVLSDDAERQRVERDAADGGRRSEHRLYDAIVLMMVQYWEALAQEAARLAE